MKLFTIGHSNDSLEYFLGLIRRNGIDTIVDVRRIPYSRYARQFNKKTLAEYLKSHKIHYVFMGNTLGGKITDPRYLTENGQVNYLNVMKSERFLKGIARLENGVKKGYIIALLCAEKDPLKCHRFHLISQFLVQWGYEILHIVNENVFGHGELERKTEDLFSVSASKPPHAD
jgi:uncharacterized protein (DUF488 family)